MRVGHVTYSYSYIGVKGLFLLYGKNPVDGYNDNSACYVSNLNEQFNCALKIDKVRTKDKLVERR